MHMIDTHAHYDDEAFAPDLPQVLEEARAAGVTHIINAATGFDSFAACQTLTKEHDMMFTAIGIHPERVFETMREAARIRERLEQGEDDAVMPYEDRIAAFCEDSRVVAIGEIGLDYHYDTPAPDASEEEKAVAAGWDHGNDPVNWPPRRNQRHVFLTQLMLAKQKGLPVVVHSRDAAEDTLRILKELRAGDIGCDMHCFGYSKESAREFLDIGCYLGIGGVSTFKNGRKLKEVIAYAPLDRLLLETDAPYLAPEPYRGKRNASGYLPYVADAIAEIKGISREKVTEQTTENARKLFEKLPR